MRGPIKAIVIFIAILPIIIAFQNCAEKNWGNNQPGSTSGSSGGFAPIGINPDSSVADGNNGNVIDEGEPLPPSPLLGKTLVLSMDDSTFSGDPAETIILPHDNSYAIESGQLYFRFTPQSVENQQGIFSKDIGGFGEGDHLSVYTNGTRLIVRLQNTETSEFVRINGALAVGVESELTITFNQAVMSVEYGGQMYTATLLGANLQSNIEPIALGALIFASNDRNNPTIESPFTGTIAEFKMYSGLE